MPLFQLIQQEPAANTNDADPISGVTAHRRTSDPELTRVISEPPAETDTRARAMDRFLSAQTDISDDVLLLYKMVCNGFR